MTSRQRQPDSEHTLRATRTAAARLLLVDSDTERLLLTRQWTPPGGRMHAALD